jgi:hypothetical protein
MIPAEFPEYNIVFNPPPDLEESQCGTVQGYVGYTKGGSCDGAPVVVVAWRPTAEEIEDLKKGAFIYR